MTIPKAQFSNVGRFYEAAIASNVNPVSMNQDVADSLIRVLARSSWIDANQDIWKLWVRGGDTWVQLIKDVRSYGSEVNRARRAEKAQLKAASKSQPAPTSES